MHPEFARLVIRGGNDAAPGSATADGDGLALERRVVAHFDRGVKAVGIDMDDFALGLCG